MRLRFAVAVAIALAGRAALADVPVPPPVTAVVDARLPIGDAVLPVFVSQDWSRPLPDIRRVVIVVHGYDRNAADYARIAMDMFPPADTLIVTPQFLAPEDFSAHQLPDAVLRWQRDAWSGGEPAEGPARSSTLDAIDAILAKTGDRAVFPNLSQVVLAGFSAGGQLVQRYAVVGRGEDATGRAGIALRYVVGSPSSFVYFGDERPEPTTGCPNFNRWKYGFAEDLPPYVGSAAKEGVPALERRYATRLVVYLVGANDNDPNHRFLDKSCAAETQGPTRLARSTSFLAVLRRRDGDIPKHRMWTVAGAAHNAAKVLGSSCGRIALFGDANCPGQEETK
jgi:pimeloyl-ACP methyl ester carboxylesterase